VPVARKLGRREQQAQEEDGREAGGNKPLQDERESIRPS
jgi:hypothetical protein